MVSPPTQKKNCTTPSPPEYRQQDDSQHTTQDIPTCMSFAFDGGVIEATCGAVTAMYRAQSDKSDANMLVQEVGGCVNADSARKHIAAAVNAASTTHGGGSCRSCAHPADARRVTQTFNTCKGAA